MLNYIDGFIGFNEANVIQKYPMSSLSYYKDEPYEINNLDGEWQINHLPSWNINDRHVKELMNVFNTSYFIIDEKESSNEFSNSLVTSNNNSKIFSNGRITIWN